MTVLWKGTPIEKITNEGLADAITRAGNLLNGLRSDNELSLMVGELQDAFLAEKKKRIEDGTWRKPTVYDLNPAFLIKLMEECGEVSQACSKIIFMGADNFNPDTGVTNIEALHMELGDIDAWVKKMRLDEGLIYAYSEGKQERIEEYILDPKLGFKIHGWQ